MQTCSACQHEVLPGDDSCTNCGRAAATSFRNPAVEVVTAQLDQTAQQQATEAPRSFTPAPEPAPRVYAKPPLTIGGWSFFDKVRFRWGGAGGILLGVALIGGGHSAGAAVFGVLFIGLGIATWVLTGFGRRGQEEFGDDWYSAWNSMPTNGRIIAGTGSVIGVLFLYILFFWFFIILWVIKNIIT